MTDRSEPASPPFREGSLTKAVEELAARLVADADVELSTLEVEVLKEHLDQALNSRVVIEQAKGIVAERCGVDVEQAFQLLRRHARHHDLRLADLAGAVIIGAIAPTTLDPLPASTSTP